MLGDTSSLGLPVSIEGVWGRVQERLSCLWAGSTDNRNSLAWQWLFGSLGDPGLSGLDVEGKRGTAGRTGGSGILDRVVGAQGAQSGQRRHMCSPRDQLVIEGPGCVVRCPCRWLGAGLRGVVGCQCTRTDQLPPA